MSRIKGPTAAADYVRIHGSHLAGSVLALFLDKNFDLLAMDCLGQGRAADCEIKPHLLVRRGLQLGAIGFVLIQNSPERLSKATAAEIELTREIRRAGEDFDVHLLNHLILTRRKVLEVFP
ncbi:MAG TPA: JAB domain-containing protein [Sphingomicrobium sp.]